MKELRILLPFVRPYRWGIAAGLLLVFIASTFSILAPELIGRAIDALYAPGITVGALLRHAAPIVLVALLGGIARFFQRWLLNGISRRIEVDLRDAFFEHLVRLDAAFYGNTPTGDLMSRATNDTVAVRQAIGPAVMYLADTLLSTALALTFMIRISPRLTLLSLIPLVALAPITLVFGRLIHRRFEKIQDHFGRLQTMVQENLAGARIVRAYVRERAQEREFDALNAAYFDKNMALARISAAFSPLLALLTGLGTVIVFWFGGTQIIAGEITVGRFVAFTAYLARLAWPMIALGWTTNLLQRGAASMGRIHRILSIQPRITEPAQPVRLADVRGEIEFRNVRFRYPGTERDVLHGISFRIPAGKTVALVGPTGSGKSTILALMTRLYDPTEGEILLDSVPLPNLSLAQLRGAFGVVPQDAFLFSETIAENIAFGLPPGPAPRTASARPPRSRGSTAQSPSSLKATRLASASAASTCPAASASAPPSHARWPATRRSSSSTTPSAPSTPRPRPRSSNASAASSPAAPRSSPATASPRSSTPISSSSSTKAASSSAAPTRNSSPATASTPPSSAASSSPKTSTPTPSLLPPVQPLAYPLA